MSKESEGSPRHAKHFASNPAEATFRFTAPIEHRSAPRHGAKPMEEAGERINPPEVSEPLQDEPIPEDDDATVLMPQGNGTEEAISTMPSEDEPHSIASSPHSSPTDDEATRLMAYDPSEEATRLAAVPNPADPPTESDQEATQLASAPNVDNEATRLAAIPNPADLPTVASATRDEATQPATVPHVSEPDGEATRLISPEDEETNEVLFPEHETQPYEDRTFIDEGPTNPEGVRLGKNEIAAVPVHHTDYSNDAATPYISVRQAKKTPEERRHTRKVVAILVCIAILTGLAGVCIAFYHSFMSNTQTEDVQQFNTATIQSGEFIDSIDNSTVLRPVQTQDVIPQVSGTIASVSVQDGDQVSKGDVLFTLANQTITDEAAKAKDAADQAQQEVTAKTQDQTTAQQELDAANKAVTDAQSAIDNLLGVASGTTATFESEEDANTGDSDSETSDATHSSEQTVEEAEEKLPDADKAKLSSLETELQAAHDKVTEAEAKVQSAQSALQTANDNLSTLKDASDKAADQVKKLTVTAPFAGTVSDLSDSATEGSEVTGSSVLCTVSDVSQFVVTATVPESKISQVSVGQTARLTFPDLPDLGTIEASVTKIGSTPAQSGNDTVYPVTITITDPDSSLTTGTTVQSSIILQSLPDSLIVPIEAVQTGDDGNSYLDVLLDPTRGIHTMIQVTVTASSDTQAAVESPNIQADTQVILPDSSTQDTNAAS